MVPKPFHLERSVFGNQLFQQRGVDLIQMLLPDYPRASAAAKQVSENVTADGNSYGEGS